MIVFRVWVDMPELLPLLPPLLLDRVGVGVVTATDVELLTDPSVAVTMMTVVEVTGVGVAVVVALESAADVVPAESVADAAVSDAVDVGGGPFWVVEAVVGVSTAMDVVVGVVRASVVVGSAGVVASTVEVGVVVAVVLVSSVVAGAVVVVSSEVMAADVTVFTLPLGLRSAKRSLRANSLLYRPMTAASIMKPWATVVADSAAVSSCSTRVEYIVLYVGRLGRDDGKPDTGRKQ